jgi:hypothetical protein
MLRRVGSALWGYVLYAVGILLLGWVLINLFVQVQPEAEGRSPGPAALAGAVMVLIGIRRVTDTPWYEWRIWRNSMITGALVLFLVVFGLAYCLNLFARLGSATPGSLAYLTVALDLLFLILLGRVTWLVARIFWQRPFDQ